MRVGGIYRIKHFGVIKPLLGVREQRGPSPRCVLSMTGARVADLGRQSLRIKRHTAGLIPPQREEGAEALIAAGLQISIYSH